MCGIGGIFYRDGRLPDDSVLRRIGADMRHRGPDDEGIFLHENFGMVHRRLSVIDLETGHQPIFNEARNAVTILNGEIYNYRELRRDLESKGHRFSTSSDTEVLVHLYEDAGDLGFLDVVDGMFALAIYDLERRILWLARDRTGKKPIYYYDDGKLFAYASELQALERIPGLSLTPCPQAVDLYLRYNYVPSPRSIYREVRKLPAAHTLRLDRERLSTNRYWRIPAPQVDNGLSDRDFAESFRDCLKAAVQKRMIADVPLGAFLSGGLDSTAIVMLMSQLTTTPVSTFSIGFGDRSFDESEVARGIADRLETNHHDEMRDEIDLGEIDSILGHFGEPYGDNSAVPSYFLCRMARQGVTVALSGDGADEVLAGYNRYFASLLADRWQRLPRVLRFRPALRWISVLPEDHRYYGDSFIKKLKLLARFIDRTDRNASDIMPIVIDDEARASMYSDDFRAAVSADARADPVLERAIRWSDLKLTERMLWTDLESYLADDINVKVDRMSMAHSLEVRCPFLDVRLLEFLSTAPLHLKIRGTETKRMLRDMVGERFPDVAARRKHGFEAPVGEWIKNGLSERIDDLFAGELAGEFFDRSRLRGLLKAHRSQNQDFAKPIWAIFVLLQWAESSMRHH